MTSHVIMGNQRSIRLGVLLTSGYLCDCLYGYKPISNRHILEAGFILVFVNLNQATCQPPLFWLHIESVRGADANFWKKFK